MINELNNLFRQSAHMATQEQATTRVGTVTSYDPNTYSAKVQIQPENVETGWLPVTSLWVGNGWGMFSPPTPGDMVQVEFQEGSIDAGMIVGRFFNDSERPLTVPSGEFWIQHKSGSFLKFHNDGSIEVVANTTASYTATQHNFHGPVTMDDTLNVTKKVTGTGGLAISGGTGATVSGNMAITGGNVTADGIGLKTHTHTGVQTGSGSTGGPQG